MDEKPVFFSNGVGERIQQDFDRAQLKLGQKVFATLGNSGEIVKVEKYATTDAKPFWVGSISPSEWFVELNDTFVVPNHFIQRIQDALPGLITEDEIRTCMVKLQAQYRPEFQHLTSEWEKNPLAVVFTILERLNLLQKLEAVSDQLTNYHYEELASYLMLTCFDRLGQPADWVDFGNWLVSSRKREEREAALAGIQNNDLVSAATMLHTSYTKIYGVKNSFFRFVKEMLSIEMRSELFKSINIDANMNPPVIEHLPPANEEDKLKYLFRRRNDYTHKAAFSPPCGSLLSQSKTNIIQEFKADRYVTTVVKDWPSVLERAVRNGLAYYLIEHGK